MKKYFIISLFFVLAAGQAFAAAGQKAIPVCAYFTNTADMLETIAVIGSETDSEGIQTDLSQFVADECFRPSKTSNEYRVFGMTPAHSSITSSSTYDPRADFNAYSTSIDLEMGTMYVPTSSTLTSVKNAYKIMRLDNSKAKLIVEPVRTEKYYAGKTDPTIIMGKATKLSEGDTSVVSSNDKVFTDVPGNSPYYQALKYLKDNNIVSGYADGSFKPNDTINRAELTKIIAGTLVSQTELDGCMSHYAAKDSYMSNVFKDVTFAMVGGNDPVWYFNYICAAKFKGFISGYADGSFKPTQKINFAEAAKIITNAFGYEMNSSNPWYETYVKTLDRKKAIPTTIKTFSQNITRGEMAEIVWRLKDYVTDQPSASYTSIK